MPEGLRDPARIPAIMARLQKVWEQVPDLSLAPLIECVAPGPKPLHVEDEELVEGAEKSLAYWGADDLNGGLKG